MPLLREGHAVEAYAGGSCKLLLYMASFSTPRAEVANIKDKVLVSKVFNKTML